MFHPGTFGAVICGEIRKDSDPASINSEVSVFCFLASWPRTLKLEFHEQILDWIWWIHGVDFCHWRIVIVEGDLRALNVALTLSVMKFLCPCPRVPFQLFQKSIYEHLQQGWFCSTGDIRRNPMELVRTRADLSTGAEFFRINCKKMLVAQIFFLIPHVSPSEEIKINVKGLSSEPVPDTFWMWVKKPKKKKAK